MSPLEEVYIAITNSWFFFFSEVTDNLLASQAFIFFLAGFETSSSTMSNALYELALNPPIQNKLRDEIKQILKQDGKLSYDAVNKMTYLDKVFKGYNKIFVCQCFFT